MIETLLLLAKEHISFVQAFVDEHVFVLDSLLITRPLWFNEIQADPIRIVNVLDLDSYSYLIFY